MNDLITTTEFSKIAGVGLSTVISWRDRYSDFPHEVKHPKPAHHRTLYFRRAEVERFLRKHQLGAQYAEGGKVRRGPKVRTKEIEKARRFIEENPNVTWKQVEAHSKVSKATVQSRGVHKKRYSSRIWTRETLIDVAFDWMREHGRFPKNDDWKHARGKYPSRTSVHIVFGKWSVFKTAVMEQIERDGDTVVRKDSVNA